MSEMLNIVYLYGFSPKDEARIETLFSMIENQSSKSLKLGIVLIHDGVIHAFSKRKNSEYIRKLIDLSIKIYVVAPDLKARGILLDNINEGMKPIDYEDLVDILDTSEKIVSWM